MRMKIRCDFCEKEEAKVFCSADEAALCESCDVHIHHANLLATKHLRFSLLHPSSSKQSPLCDICQERRAFLFCQEDRAILCRECDVGIHTANEQTKKHNRYLLTGVQLSSSSCNKNSCLYTSSSSSSSSYSNNKSENNNKINENLMSSTRLSSSVETPVPTSTTSSTSSISEYLENLPGWNVDDFLDPSNANWKGVNVESDEQPYCWWV